MHATLPHRARRSLGSRSLSFFPTTALATVLAIALATGTSAPPARADAYRWVDENGVTVYSQRPPPAGDSARIRPAPAPSAQERARAQERTRALVEQDFDRREDEKDAAQNPEAAAEAQAKAAKAANCESARKNLETLETRGQGRLRLPDGKITFLSKDELAAKKDEAKAQIESNCQ